MVKKGKLQEWNRIFSYSSTNNAIRTNYIKARIDKTQQNNRCKLCSDTDETINHIISECSKLAQKEYKTGNDWVGKVIHMELCEKFKFDYRNKWYIHNPASVLENETYKFIWCFEIQTDYLISTRRPDLILVNKKKKKKKKKGENLPNCGLCCPSRLPVKLKESEKKGYVTRPYKGIEKTRTWKWRWYQL